MPTTEQLFQASEFAERANVTVRALHHYDRLGLLKPSARSAAGYRLYSARDFVRLQQIVTLKFIGFPLKEIKNLLERASFDLPTALRQQREVIEEKQRRLDMAAQAIARVEGVLAAQSEPDWEAFAKIIEVINMQNDLGWMNKYYDEEARQALHERRQGISQDFIEKGQQDWAVLIKDVETAISEGVDPASERAKALADRCSALIEAFTGGNQAISDSLKKLYADEQNWPSTFQKPYSDEVGNFISQATAANKK
jgi:DNA-binding transcriptional MerR regulator